MLADRHVPRAEGFAAYHHDLEEPVASSLDAKRRRPLLKDHKQVPAEHLRGVNEE